MTALPCRRFRCERSCVQVRPQVRWPVVLLRAGRTLLMLVGVAVLVRLACLLPDGSRWSGPRVLSTGCRALLWSLRVDLRDHGGPGPRRGLIVANHVSWLDIPVLAATGPLVPVAKTEIAGWPVIGPVARGLGAVFVDRRRLRSLPATVASMASALRAGACVQVFPEATTRCGTALDPFRRAAFQAALDAAVPVRPVALAYRDRSGRPTSAVAFVGDQTLLASVVAMLRGGPIVAEVRWAAPLVGSGPDRSAAARTRTAATAQQAVADLLGQPILVRPRTLTVSGPPPARWYEPAA